MPKVLRYTLLSARDLLVTAGPFLLVAVVLLGLAYWVLDPNPPKKVVLATGPDQGAYAEFGKRYAALLKQHGIRVDLRATQGAAENLALLRDDASNVDLAFVQGGAEYHVRALVRQLHRKHAALAHRCLQRQHQAGAGRQFVNYFDTKPRMLHLSLRVR